MSSTISRTSHGVKSRPARSTARRSPGSGRRGERAGAICGRRVARHGDMLDRYIDVDGRERELVTCSGAGGSVLVVDQDARERGERRLLAHIAADEPAGNAAVVCRHFLSQARRERCRCRLLLAEDLSTIPYSGDVEQEPAGDRVASPQLDGRGRRYCLERFATGMSIPELRWACRQGQRAGACHAVSTREVIASLERYEPVRALTARALAAHGRDADVSVTVLRAELRRMQESPIVLNRRLREAVLDAVQRRGWSMSEIAMRCGRIKRDAAGNESGETSWLARRLGLLPEGGRSTTTPWIHSDVLALIARDGLGVSPREVEVE
jgi:hypothetical protein